jgi:hypothetical protein
MSHVFSSGEKAGALQHGDQQNERDRKMHNQRMEAAEELREIAPLHAIGRDREQ